MKISLITPSYKRSHYLKKNFENLNKINKKFPNSFEWIIITEKNDIKSIKVVKTFKKKFVKHLTGKFRNNDKAFNHGVKYSKGELLVIYGDDDFITEKFIREIKNNFNKKYKWYVGYGQYINNKGQLIRKNLTTIKSLLIKNYNKNILLIINFIMTPSVCFSKKEFLAIKGLNQKIKYASDYFLWLEFSKKFQPKIIEKYISKATFTSSTKTGSFSFTRYFQMFKVISKYQNNLFILFLQICSVFLIILFNFIKKRILKL